MTRTAASCTLAITKSVACVPAVRRRAGTAPPGRARSELPAARLAAWSWSVAASLYLELHREKTIVSSCEVSIGCPFGSGRGKLKLLKLWRTLGEPNGRSPECPADAGRSRGHGAPRR